VSAPDASGYRIRTIPELVHDAAVAHAERPWLFHDDTVLSFTDTERATAAVAASAAALGVVKGDVVLVVAHNTATHVVAWLGLVRAGAIVLPVNPASTVAELAGFLDQARPRLAVFDPARDEAVADAREQATTRTTWVDVHELVAANGSATATGAPPDAGITPRDPAVLIPTSGTTGRSKLVTQTHQAYVLAGEGFPWWMQLTPDDRLITALPIFHVNAPVYSLLGSMAIGASVVLLSRFSPSRFVDEARRTGATEFNMIGAMLEMLMRQPERPDDADNPLRLCYTGPSPTRERHLEIERRFGIQVVCGYGMSESTYGTFWAHGERPYETIGSARQHPVLGHVNDARVMDDDGGEVATGDVGELVLRNPAIMLGYREMPDETATVLVDGWLHTGDLVRANRDGTFTFVSRKKDVIRRRGENLAPAEVEEALEAHPDVLEAAVIAVPSELGEDEIKAFVVGRPDRALDPMAVRASLLERVARFKVPRFVEIVDDLPRTPTGRLAKHRLPRERTVAEIDFDAQNTVRTERSSAGRRPSERERREL
jgi:crotonobetaine/carnitine-CoA ligase